MNKLLNLIYRRTELLISLCLILVTLAVFWPVRNHDFINYDDPLYISENPHIREGLTWEGIQWAFSADLVSASRNADYWLPVTFLSHMLTIELFGMNPAGHHLVNLGLHVLNSLLLFWVFQRITRDLWPSAFVALVFAIHPLQVESVAWVTERKDVLSTFFGMLTLMAYVGYTERPKPSRYLLMTLFFALGLMAKPMLVTLPFVLLLLDYWPLGRLRSEDGGGLTTEWKLGWEKISLFALTAITIIITYLAAQRDGALVTIDSFPLGVRVGNALVSYVRYMGKMVWPQNLVVFYPYPGDTLPMWQVAGAGVVLVVISVLVVMEWRRRPYLIVGWLWYLGTLLPVIGIVQVGRQAMADRFTYIPLIGLLIIFSWGASELMAAWRYGRTVLVASAGVLFLTLMVLTRFQLNHWRNNITLYEYTLQVMPDNYLAHNNMGTALSAQQKPNEAIAHFSQALAIRPKYGAAHKNLGVELANQGRFEMAITHYIQALQAVPNFSDAHNSLGSALTRQGRVEEAITHYFKALELNPDNETAHYNMGEVLAQQGRLDEAITHYTQALSTRPSYPDALNNLGVILMTQGKFEEALIHFSQLIAIKPEYGLSHYNMGLALTKLGRSKEAIPHYTQAVAIMPDNTQLHNNLGVALAEQGKVKEAVGHYMRALEIEPDYEVARHNLGLALGKKERKDIGRD